MEVKMNVQKLGKVVKHDKFQMSARNTNRDE